MSTPTAEIRISAVPPVITAASTEQVLTSIVAPMVTPLVQQATTAETAALQDAVTQTHAASLALISGLEVRVTANEQAIQDALAKAGTAVIADITEDQWLQRAVVLTIVGAVLVGSLAVVAFALLGDSTANKWIGAAPAAIVALVLWLSKAGVSSPTKAAAPKQP